MPTSLRVAIAGAGKVGRSIAKELQQNGHDVLLIDKDAHALRTGTIGGVEMIRADACEAQALEEANLASCQVLIAATGDDKTNLVVSLLAKTEFGVPRVVARVNHPKNEWLFDETWGVDVAVSTPRLITAMLEEAVTEGDLVSLMKLRSGQAELCEIKLPTDSPLVGKRVDALRLPTDCALVAILRGEQVIVPSKDDQFATEDELLFIIAPDLIASVNTILNNPLR